MRIHGDSAARFQRFLKDALFQSDAADLDFGIYRIINHKRTEIDTFIEEGLIQAVSDAFDLFQAQTSQELLTQISEKTKEIERLERDLGERILTNGRIAEKFEGSPFAAQYSELKQKLAEVEATESEQSHVFNDLYVFFSRYYEDGDFVSKRRYSSRDARYAIPYNGEEVKLHWANFDQYYVKTGEVFKDYVFCCGDWHVAFTTAFADVEAGNVKGQRRCFLLAQSDTAAVDEERRACRIAFDYRRLTDEDLPTYKVSTKANEGKKVSITQAELTPILAKMILRRIRSPYLKAVLSERPDDKTVLEKQLHRYTRKITSDFFIHRDLQGFLERELDYFIKTEVLDVHYPDPRHFTRAKVVETIGNRVIAFLASIEEYQKLLWEKKKFVLETHYVITTDRVSEELLEEVVGCEAQLQEWKKLGFGQIAKKRDFSGKKLPVDTKYFDPAFKEKLLEELSHDGNLDDLLDGVLLKSENWQALSLLKPKYGGRIQTIYIDPPFNTGKDFLYKDHYQDSSWIALMCDRFELSRDFLQKEGSFYLHIDRHAKHLSKILLNSVFGEPNFKAEIAWDTCGVTGFKSSPNNWIRNADYLLFYTRSYDDNFFVKPYSVLEKDERTRLRLGWLDILDTDDAPYVERWADGVLLHKPVQTEAKLHPVGMIWTDVYSFLFTQVGNNESFFFKTQKPEHLLRRIIQSSTAQTGIVMDFFLGVGTTTAVAHKLNRKWVGVEMGDHFDTFYESDEGLRIGALGRMKIVLHGDQRFSVLGHRRCPQLSRNINWKGGGFFKYHRLEQYEDTLHNIEFTKEGKGEAVRRLFPDKASEYVMKYMLRHETQGCSSLLNIERFEDPLGYKLSVVSNGSRGTTVDVDLVETFNYLLGLKVDRYKFLNQNGRKYTVVFGERKNRRVAVVWRATKDIDLSVDRDLIHNALATFHPDETFVNGDACIQDYKVIESEFKALMGV